MIRPASVGARATMTCRPVATSPPRHVTVTRSAEWSMVSTGEFSTIRSPRVAASRCGICEVPPTKRLVWAPPSDSASSSAVTPQTATFCSRHSSDTSTVGIAKMPTVQISSRVRATGGQTLAVVPLADGDAIPLVGPGRGPRSLDGHGVGHPIDLAAAPARGRPARRRTCRGMCRRGAPPRRTRTWSRRPRTGRRS